MRYIDTCSLRILSNDNREFPHEAQCLQKIECLVFISYFPSTVITVSTVIIFEITIEKGPWFLTVSQF